MPRFANKKILIGVSGGIAAYKVGEIIRELKKEGATCRVVMTSAAQKFMTPLTFKTLSEAPVLIDLFLDDPEFNIVHIDAARWADGILICPASANLIGKIANGIADDLLTTLVMATKAPVLLCPAMNTQMYLNPVVQANLKKLIQFNYQIIEPTAGELACKEEGIGRLAEKSTILNALKKIVLGTSELKDKKILITAGRTEEAWDVARILTNRSSGKMGFALAEAAALKGAKVGLISGPNQLIPFPEVELIRVTTAAEMAEAVLQRWHQYDILIMAAAVADFRPRTVSTHKIKKAHAQLSIELEPTTDILAELAPQKGEKIFIGFAVETDNIIESAKQKLKQKNLDLIVLNNPLEPGAGFATDTNKVFLIDRTGTIDALPLMPKSVLAERIIERVIEFINVL